MNKSKTEDSNVKKPATIHHVAKLAGVSTATVSRVLAGADLVSDELIARVNKAARELNYHTNRTARNLRMQKNQTAALVISDIENPFFTSIVRGVEGVLRKAGYMLILTNSDEDEQIEWDHLMNLRAEGVAGVIIAPTGSDAKRYDQLIQAGMTMVAIDRVPPNLAVDRVTVNNGDAVYAATKYLINQGHSQIGVIAGLSNISTALERKTGYERAMKEKNFPINPTWIQQGNFRQEDGHKAMRNILHLDPPPTAVIALNNLMTLGALQAIYEEKVKVPEQMAIIGFDDMAWGNSSTPPLTAVAQPTHELGRVAAELLLDRINDPSRPLRHVILDTELIIRASAGPHKE